MSYNSYMAKAQLQTLEPLVTVPEQSGEAPKSQGLEHLSKHNHELSSAYKDQIICDDSLKCLQQLPHNCVDLVVTSPPYNFGLDYADHRDVNKWEDYYNNLFAIFAECIRVIKYGGAIIVNVQPLYSDYIPSHHLLSNFFYEQGLKFKNEILWEKNHYNCKYTAWGSWKSPSNPYIKGTWEFLEVFCKGTTQRIDEIIAKSAKSRDNVGDDWLAAKWKIAPERDMKKYNHPAMFPEKLIARVLDTFSLAGDIVLDPFNGAGTTTLVAAKKQRHYVGIELSQEYCDEAYRG